MKDRYVVTNERQVDLLKKAGFSFIEVLFGAAIFAMAALVLMTTFQGGAREAKTSEDHLKAITIAQKEIERVKQVASLGRDSIKKFWSNPGERVRRYTVDNFYKVATEIDANRKVEIGGSPAEVGEIVVSVSWFRRGKGEEELIFSSIFDQAYH